MPYLDNDITDQNPTEANELQIKASTGSLQNRGGFKGVRGDSVDPIFTPYFIFNLGNHFYPKYINTSLLVTIYSSSTSKFYYLWMC